jgi:hypothetical protein
MREPVWAILSLTLMKGELMPPYPRGIWFGENGAAQRDWELEGGK